MQLSLVCIHEVFVVAELLTVCVSSVWSLYNHVHYAPLRGFFETAPFKRYSLKCKRKSQLQIRSSLWLTSDQVFLFDVQRSTSDYYMREYKHAYTLPVKALSLPALYQLRPRTHALEPHLSMKRERTCTCRKWLPNK